MHGKDKETAERNFVEDEKDRTLEIEGCGTHVNVKEKASRRYPRITRFRRERGGGMLDGYGAERTS